LFPDTGHPDHGHQAHQQPVPAQQAELAFDVTLDPFSVSSVN
jgi:hypothetical protein